MAKGLSHNVLVLIGIVASFIMILGGISLMNYVAHPYQNLTLVAVALISLTVGGLLLVSSIFSFFSGMFQRNKEPQEHHAGHEAKEHHEQKEGKVNKESHKPQEASEKQKDE